MSQRARALKSRLRAPLPFSEEGIKHLSSSKPQSEDNAPASSGEFEEASSQSSLNLDEEDDTGDAPRVSQWVEDDDEVYVESVNVQNTDSPHLTDLQTSLAELPLGALRRAQQVLQRVEVVNDTDEGSESDHDSGQESEDLVSKVKQKETVKWSTKSKSFKRSSKHAPTEITSKKPVTRRRTVVEVPKIIPRDPRFLPTAGEFKPEEFNKAYGFLTESHKSELQTLREHLKSANKLLSSCPRNIRSEREAEVHRLEQAIKRTESLVNRDRHDQIRREALRKVAQEEKDKQKQGKGKWWMRESDKRELVTRARYEALAADGGRKAVKKAIEKKQKKISQREKKARPFPKGGFLEGDRGRKRVADGDAAGNSAKRRRFS